MRLRYIILVLFSSFIFQQMAAAGDTQERNRQLKKIEGRWGRSNHRWSFNIEDGQFREFEASTPIKPTNTGTVTTQMGQDYAVVKVNENGLTLWIFSAGENVIGVETFQPSGRCADAGRVFYRVGTEMP